MAGKPKKATSEFTKLAFARNVQQAALVAGCSDTFYYDMLAGRHPDYLDRGRDEHRVLCTVNPQAAADYRALLAHDSEYMRGGARSLTDETARDIRRRLLKETVEAQSALDEKAITQATSEDLARWERVYDAVIRVAMEGKSAIRAAREELGAQADG
jgi:hypothetical protein